MGRTVAIASLVGLLGACRATPGVVEPADLSDTGDLSAVDLAGPPPEDLLGADLRCSGPSVPEVCGNGCDDDRNGYLDDDDPACRAQVLVIYDDAQPFLGRLFLEPELELVPLDGNPVAVGYTGPSYQRAFAPSLYLAVEGANPAIRTISPVPNDMGAGKVTSYSPKRPPDDGATWVYGAARDTCVFNGELIVIERGGTSVLHRMMADGATEIGEVSLGAVNASACASDGKLLYVAIFNPSDPMSPLWTQFYVFDQSYQQLDVIPLPQKLLDPPLYLYHLLDFAWTPRLGFVGLFTTDLSYNESSLNNEVAVTDADGGSSVQVYPLYPFSLDGAVGDPIDAGVLHGLGSFEP